MRYLIFILILLSCKKETASEKTAKVEELKTFSVTVTGAKTQIVKLNGVQATPPLSVKSGDQVFVDYAEQPTTPASYKLYVSFYLDGVKLSQCNGCFEYKNTFNIQ